MIIRVKDNNIYLHGTIWDGDDQYFLYHFNEIVDKFDELEVHLHTNGGSVFAANFIMTQLALAEAKIHYVIDGIAASMGFIMMLTGNEISMVENGYLMSHAPQGSTRGTASEHRDTANLLDEIGKNFIKKLIARTGWSKSKAKKLLVGDNWFSAEQALKEGLIDRIIDPVLDVKIDDAKALGQQEVFGRFAAILVDKNTPKNKIKTTKMKQELIEALGLQNVNAQSSDTAVISAVNAHIDSKVNTVQGKLDALIAENNTLVEAAKTQKTAKIDALLAPLAGKASKEKIEMYRGIGEKSGLTALEGVLEGVTTRKSLADSVKAKSGEAVSDKTWDEYQKTPQGQKELEELSQTNAEAYLELGQAKFGKNWKS